MQKLIRREFMMSMPIVLGLGTYGLLAAATEKKYVPQKNLYWEKVNYKKALLGNENYLNCSENCFEAAIESWGVWNRYISQRMNLEDLRKALSTEVGVDIGFIRLAPGSTMVLRMIVLGLIEKGDIFIATEPDFNRVQEAAKQRGAIIKHTPPIAFCADLDAMLKQSKGAKIIYLSNPQIPLGGMNSKKSIENFLAQLPKNIFVIVDEAYIQFSAQEYEKNSVIALTSKYKNLIVVRTFSKIYGLAAMRVGYLVAHPEAIDKMTFDIENEYAVSNISLAAAKYALADKKHVIASRAHVDKMKDEMASFCKKIGLVYNRGFGNFITLFFPGESRKYVEEIAKYGFNFKLRSGNHLYVTMDSKEVLTDFREVLKKII